MPVRAPSQNFLVRVAKRIAQQRQEAEMTQEQLADRIETAVRNVQRIESGTQNLTLLTVAKIASALGVQPEDLLGPAPVAGEPSRAKKSRS